MRTGFFRYPGGKSKLCKVIVDKLLEVAGEIDLEYREPFFGGGSIGLQFLQNKPDTNSIWINDLDKGISCLWTTLIKHPDFLKDYVLSFKPSVELFYEYKRYLIARPPELLSPQQIASYGFKKLAIHQISYSGLGTKSGGPLGGEKQNSDYKIDCRWSPKHICKQIDLLHEQFSKYEIRNKRCTNEDFSECISDAQCNAIIYLDPPYFDKGNTLYQHGFTLEDHKILAQMLKETNHKWVLSYDDCEQIRDLYSWANIDSIGKVNYSITALLEKDETTGKRSSRSKPELLIYSRKN